MKRMNVNAVNFGAESGSDHVLQYLKGGSVTVAKNQAAIDKLNDYGIAVACSFVVGSPAERREDAQATLDFVRRNKNKMVGAEFFPTVAYPGTQMWTDALMAGKIKMPIEDWGQFSLSVKGDGPQFWEKYVFLNDHMDIETFRMYFHQMQELSMELALNKTTKRIHQLEAHLYEEWDRISELNRFKERRAVKALEKALNYKDRLFAMLRRNSPANKLSELQRRQSKVTTGSSFNCG